jgi:hypothetical protein
MVLPEKYVYPRGVETVDWDFTALALLLSLWSLDVHAVDESDSSKYYILFLTCYKFLIIWRGTR